MFNRLRFPSSVFFAASFLGLLLLYYAIGGNSWPLVLSALAYGFVLGFAIQSCLRQPLPKRRVAVASFCGSFVLWLPVVVVSYGFALAATPVFLAYSTAVIAGLYLASLRRSNAA